ncbi:MAG: efflux RND transporter periplasmic adaptor subunit [Puniceicoccales bacterium]|jgi:multidrug efflux system membrane fusion protein|nr:efflux RND transporter periplasmic adaptor subunit [Puniceicoccales bacterium]
MKILNIACTAMVAVALVFAGGCGKKAQMARPPTPVVSTVAISADVPLYIETIGRCVSSESVAVVPQVSGQIIAVSFEQGQAVKAGDQLYAIDPQVYEANLKKAEARLEVAEAKMRVDAAQMERSEALISRNYVSQQQFETYESQVTQDIALVEEAKAQVDQARIDLEHCNVHSPIDGVAGAYLIDVGNVVVAMSIGKPLVTVENVDQLYVEFSISENDFYDLQRCFGDGGNQLSAEVSPISGGAVRGNATVKFIDNAINAKTGSLRLRALMPNGDRKFWPGQSVRVRVLLATLKDAVLIPIEAVKLGQQGRYVFTIGEDKSVGLRMVEIGQTHGEMLLIKDGLSAGEAVVLRGQLMLAPGMKVVELPSQQTGVFKQSLEHNRKIAEKNPTTK